MENNFHFNCQCGKQIPLLKDGKKCYIRLNPSEEAKCKKCGSKTNSDNIVYKLDDGNIILLSDF